MKRRGMDHVRKHHNQIKRALIQNTTRVGSIVLDVGCGAGGDLQKWFQVGVKSLDMCDPNSLDEAKSRAKNLNMKVNFYQGDILECPKKTYDVIAYNFSLHYIFETKKLFLDTIHAIRVRLRIGGKLFGVIPDSEAVLMLTPFSDQMGNRMIRGPTTGHGDFGEKLFVFLSDTPYYKEGPMAEPIAYKDLLVTHLDQAGIVLDSWTTCEGPEAITRMYAQFVFTRLR
jgi:SAM-dependent methyltransferase